MERRKFLGAVSGASLGVLLQRSFAEPALAETRASLAGQDSFETSQVEVSGNTVFVRR
jgi:hypothetical protein